MGYVLVNPNLKNSNFKSSSNKKSNAAKEIWSEFSKNIKNFIPEFYFTIQNENDGSLSHFKVNESMENDQVKFNIKSYNSKKINDQSLKEIINQEGGKHRRKRHHKKDSSDSSDTSSSSSSSSSEEILIGNVNAGDPLSLLYSPCIYGVPNISLPYLGGVLVNGYPCGVTLNLNGSSTSNMPLVINT